MKLRQIWVILKHRKPLINFLGHSLKTLQVTPRCLVSSTFLNSRASKSGKKFSVDGSYLEQPVWASCPPEYLERVFRSILCPARGVKRGTLTRNNLAGGMGRMKIILVGEKWLNILQYLKNIEGKKPSRQTRKE